MGKKPDITRRSRLDYMRAGWVSYCKRGGKARKNAPEKGLPTAGFALRGQRQAYGECRAAARLALHFDFAVEQLDELLDDAEAEPAAGVFPPIDALGHVKRLEDARQVRIADADAGVGNGPDDPLRPSGVFNTDAQFNAAGFGVFHRVREQVLENFSESQTVGRDPRQAARNCDFETQPFLARQRLKRKLEVVGDVAHCELLGMKRNFFRLQAHEAENFIDELEQLPRIPADARQRLLLLIAELPVSALL